MKKTWKSANTLVDATTLTLEGGDSAFIVRANGDYETFLPLDISEVTEKEGMFILAAVAFRLRADDIEWEDELLDSLFNIYLEEDRDDDKHYCH